MSEQQKNYARKDAYALCFASALPTLQAVAREHGYALAVHGSMRRDLDVICCPWVQDASVPDVLAEALRECVGGILAPYDHNPTGQAHGRLCYAFYFDQKSADAHDGPYIDISVMPMDKMFLTG